MMFAENKKISGNQLFRLLLLDMFATACMLVPRILVRVSGGQGIFTLVITLGLASAYGWLIYTTVSQKEGNFYEMLKKVFGKTAAVFVMFYFFIKFLCAAVFILKMFTEIIGRTFLTEMPEKVIGALVIATVLYIVSKGIETRARLSEILTWTVTVPILIIAVLSLTEMKKERLFPMEITQPLQILKGSMLLLPLFGSLEFMLFSLPYVKKEQRKFKYIACSIFISGAAAALIYIACVGVLSVGGAQEEFWPTVILMQIIHLPGHFVARQDGLMLAFWMMGTLILLSGYIFYADMIAHQICKKYSRWSSIIGGILIYGVFCVIENYELLESYYLWLMFAGGILPSALILLYLYLKACVKSSGPAEVKS